MTKQEPAHAKGVGSKAACGIKMPEQKNPSIYAYPAYRRCKACIAVVKRSKPAEEKRKWTETPNESP